MDLIKGKLIAIGGNEDKGTEAEPNYEQRITSIFLNCRF